MPTVKPAVIASTDQIDQTFGLPVHPDDASEPGAARLDFNDVPDNFGLDDELSIAGLSHITDNLAQDHPTGITVDDILLHNKDTAKDGSPNAKPGFFSKISKRFVGPKPAKSAATTRTVEAQSPRSRSLEVWKKLGLNRVHAHAGGELITLTFDQVPDELPAISDTESDCSMSDISSIASSIRPKERLAFHQVPEELPVSDDEDEFDFEPQESRDSEPKEADAFEVAVEAFPEVTLEAPPEAPRPTGNHATSNGVGKQIPGITESSPDKIAGLSEKRPNPGQIAVPPQSARQGHDQGVLYGTGISRQAEPPKLSQVHTGNRQQQWLSHDEGLQPEWPPLYMRPLEVPIEVVGQVERPKSVNSNLRSI